jgi:hypothetical protein
MKFRLVILDANVVIKAFEGNFWNILVSHYEICLPSIVLRKEVYFFNDLKTGERIDINLERFIKQGSITELSASADDLEALVSKIDSNYLERIDAGEREALALLNSGRFDDYRFCTGDMRAIKALASLDLGSFGVSLEELLANAAMKVPLPDQSYSKKAFQRKKAEGLQERDLFKRKPSKNV